MDGARLRIMIRRLRRVVTPASDGGLSDADLLRRWVTHRDEAAFEALLWRHAAAVLGVCRRVLGDEHEAEDAAQAAFLTLACKAGSIGRRQAVAAWLYTVACRTALRRVPAVRQCSLSFPKPGRSACPPGNGSRLARSTAPVLDEEVSRLPEQYRAPFVLCHVEGRTNEEAARELGCPVGTVLSRLARARQRLRDRLTRRGVTLGVLAAVVAGEARHGRGTQRPGPGVGAGRGSGRGGEGPGRGRLNRSGSPVRRGGESHAANEGEDSGRRGPRGGAARRWWCGELSNGGR